jgi:hypothetical protein
MSYETRKTRESCAKHPKPTAISKKSSSDRKAAAIEKQRRYLNIIYSLNIMQLLKLLYASAASSPFP